MGDRQADGGTHGFPPLRWAGLRTRCSRRGRASPGAPTGPSTRPWNDCAGWGPGELRLFAVPGEARDPQGEVVALLADLLGDHSQSHQHSEDPAAQAEPECRFEECGGGQSPTTTLAAVGSPTSQRIEALTEKTT